MMTALRYGPAAVDAALRALFSRRRRRRSDLDQAWRDIATLMPDHATDWRPAR